MKSGADNKPVIVHVLDHLNIGGMETVAVNLIEHSSSRYHHCVVCLRGWAEGGLLGRLEKLGVPVTSVDKKPGKDLVAYVRLRNMLHKLQPDIVHTYNIGAIDAAICARLAGVRHVVHAEHGRDAADPHGHNTKYRWFRRLLSPLISAFVPVSEDLARWLAQDIRISQKKIHLIYNGIDVERYQPDSLNDSPLPPDFAQRGSVIIGTVGRLDPVKGFDVLLEAFASLLSRQQEAAASATDLRLVIIGDGQQYTALERRVSELGIAPFVWLAGERDDIPQLLQAMDVYVCSSIAEGMALTILEAMAAGLPIVATEVGGNPELIVADETGQLVPASDSTALAQVLEKQVAQPVLLQEQGAAGRTRAHALFSIDAMVSGYCGLYDELLGTASATVEAG